MKKHNRYFQLNINIELKQIAETSVSKASEEITMKFPRVAKPTPCPCKMIQWMRSFLLVIYEFELKCIWKPLWTCEMWLKLPIEKIFMKWWKTAITSHRPMFVGMMSYIHTWITMRPAGVVISIYKSIISYFFPPPKWFECMTLYV